ncbi:MAG: hypothetical protein IJ080_03740 [Oscillospiraceae bacterium]|nr:hypothetical protein [Oscillospiraceae bacterium]
MSVSLDLAAIAPQLADAVIYMDGSPAYDAFREEIEAILDSFNESCHLSHHWKVDPPALTSGSEDTLKNMHRSFLFWSFKEGGDISVNGIYKLFFRSQEETIRGIVGGDRFDVTDAARIIDQFKNRITTDSAVYESVKAFFKGYVYGYFFNYLTEASIMANYAEMLAYLGVMSGLIETTVSQRQRAVQKMAPLLPNDRFKYIYGTVPASLMFDIIYDRVSLDHLSDEEQQVVKDNIASFIRAQFPTESEDGEERVSDIVPSEFASRYFTYIEAADVANELYTKYYTGVRTFLDCDREDVGDYNAAWLNSIIEERLKPSYYDFYSLSRGTEADVSVGSSDDVLRYPIIFKGDTFAYAGIFDGFVYEKLRTTVYNRYDLPTGIFAFADEGLMSDPVRRSWNSSESYIAVRADRIGIAEQIKRLSSEKMPAEVRNMLLLEQYLCLLSSSMSADEYRECFEKNVYGTDLYERYIRYRMNILAEQSLENDSKRKALLDSINAITL